jgi:hypothetical protein
MLGMRGVIPSLPHTSTMKNEAVASSEALIIIYQTIRGGAKASKENTLQIKK